MTALNLAILVGLAIMGAYAVTRYAYGKEKSENKKWERRCRELRGERWADLQKEIDTYRKPDGYVDYKDYQKVTTKAGERE